MISRYHCLEVYNRGVFDVAYDPIQDRVCFIVKKQNKIVGLIGRAVQKDIQPKTINYPNSDVAIPFICTGRQEGTKRPLMLVEDCFSAASATRLPVTAMALLGSTIKSDYIPYVKLHDEIIIALDRDARKKALAMKKKLCYYHQTVRMMLLSKDIKDMTDQELNQVKENDL